MKLPALSLLLASCLTMGLQGSARAADIPKSVRYVTSVRLPGSAGFADYLSVDPADHALYVGYTSRNALVAIDTRTNRVQAVVPNLPRVHAVATTPDSRFGFTSDGGENKVGVVDLGTHRILGRIPVGAGPDAIISDPIAHLVYVGNHKGHTATLIDPVRRRVVATIALGGAPEYPQADPVTGLVYQNLEDTSELVVVDPKQQAIRARYKVAPGKAPSGLALDAERHRLFSVCDNRLMVVLDERTGARVAVLPIGAGVDFAAYDPEVRRIYSANGDSATMTVVQQDSADRYRVLENVKTYPHAHALAVDPVSHRIYVVHGGEVAVYDAVR